MAKIRPRSLVKAQPLRPELTYAMPVLAVQVRLEIIRIHLALADLAGARTLMREVDELLIGNGPSGGISRSGILLRVFAGPDFTGRRTRPLSFRRPASGMYSA